MSLNLKNAKYGDIILFYPNSFYSDLIRDIDGSPYSHIATYLEFRDGYHWMLESTITKGGYVISKIREDWRNFDIFDASKYAESLRPREEMMKLIDERPYDTGRIRDLFFYYLLRKQPPMSDASRLICAEAVNIQFNNIFGKNPTPRTIYEQVR